MVLLQYIDLYSYSNRIVGMAVKGQGVIIFVILRRQGFFVAREVVAVDDTEIDKLQPQIQDVTMPTLEIPQFRPILY